ncbi:alpha/beta hydrolase family protein [Gryllotalpicola reticulitermitis]|uniref:Alpha/beta hydrolase family protein n=1 Tax=Gryllotalpicola reticulitermitis TaxID=1184153 RepID=A0ABV8QBV2_9MICO
MTVLLIVLLLVLLAVLLFAYLRQSGSRVVRSRPPRLLPVTWSDDDIELPCTPMTDAPGRYGIWVRGADEEEETHLLVGERRTDPSGSPTVHRAVRHVAGPQRDGKGLARFTGHVFPSPDSIAPRRWSEATVPSGVGPCPAWLITPGQAHDPASWGIHIHGFGTTRITALRTVPAAETLRLTCLVPSFRGDGDGPPTRSSSSTLGAAEWADIDAAIDFAVDHGAKDITLFAWSMGAPLAFAAAARGKNADRIRGIVAIAPVTDWPLLIRAGARRSGLPAFLGSFTAWGLQQPLIERSLGITTRISFQITRADARAAAERLPILILHSEDDPIVPHEGSCLFERAYPDTVTLRSFRTVGHAWEYNAEPDKFNDAIIAWYRDRTSHPTPNP